MTDRNAVTLMYVLHALAPFTFWTLAVVAIIIGFVKAPDVRGSVLESHVAYLARTFWWSLLWIAGCALISFVLIITIVGILIYWLPWVILFVWYLYRVIRGWMRLNDGLPA
jgi:uncharacterized membrane protein